jgi:hypothetical protein
MRELAFSGFGKRAGKHIAEISSTAAGGCVVSKKDSVTDAVYG